MAKKDPFEKFRQATLGGETESPLQAACLNFSNGSFFAMVVYFYIII